MKTSLFSSNLISGPRINKRLASELDTGELEQYRAFSHSLPSYRFVDLYRAIETTSAQMSLINKVVSQHFVDLNAILQGELQQWAPPHINRSPNAVWVTGSDEEIHLPTDQFWLAADTPSDVEQKLIFRLRFDQHHSKAIVEVAAFDGELAQRCLNQVIEFSSRDSIYRGKILRLAFEAAQRDEFGDLTSQDRFQILFQQFPDVNDEDFVIDEDVRKTLIRNVVDLQQRRETLKAHGVPTRRGVLLYGPPGTGKTFACRYLCSKLPETTRIIATGSALAQVSSIFSLARLLQPSLIIMEDVDLVFPARDISFQSSVLGDLLDQMDGLRRFEDIVIVLTTNSLDRIEDAIKNRPGRVSQCVYLGAPGHKLRMRYLRHYLKSYDASAINFDELASKSDGATQAFLKEWVHRSVQIATERIHESETSLDLKNNDFSAAMDEMKNHAEGAASSIIGFHVHD